MNKKIVGIMIMFIAIVASGSAVGSGINGNSFKKSIASYHSSYDIHTIDPEVHDIIIDYDYFHNAPTDDFVFNYVELTGDILEISVSYGGGCEEHDFDLIFDGLFLESYPVIAPTLLSHDSHDDPCEAWITEILFFDLTPLKEYYFQCYHIEHDIIRIALIDFGSIFYEF